MSDDKLFDTSEQPFSGVTSILNNIDVNADYKLTGNELSALFLTLLSMNVSQFGVALALLKMKRGSLSDEELDDIWSRAESTQESLKRFVTRFQQRVVGDGR